MSATATIAAREFQSLFLSPLAWVVLAIVQFIAAFLFLNQVQTFVALQPRLAALDSAPGVTEALVPALFGNIAIILLLVVPLITMRSVCEERRAKTLPLLLSAPVPLSSVVLGKFLGVWGLLLLLLGLVTLMPLSLLAGGSLDFGRLLANVLALALLTAAFTATGIYMSCVSAHPMVAALASFGLLMFLWLLGWAAAFDDSPGGLLTHLSLLKHFQNLQAGLMGVADLGYFVALSGLFLWLSVRHLACERLPT